MWTRTKYLWMAGTFGGPRKTRTASIELIGGRYRLQCFPVLGDTTLGFWSGPISIHEQLDTAKEQGRKWINHET